MKSILWAENKHSLFNRLLLFSTIMSHSLQDQPLLVEEMDCCADKIPLLFKFTLPSFLIVHTWHQIFSLLRPRAFCYFFSDRHGHVWISVFVGEPHDWCPHSFLDTVHIKRGHQSLGCSCQLNFFDLSRHPCLWNMNVIKSHCSWCIFWTGITNVFFEHLSIGQYLIPIPQLAPSLMQHGKLLSGIKMIFPLW